MNAVAGVGTRSFLKLRVKGIEAVYAEQHQYLKCCSIRDPGGHLIGVGQTADPAGDWSPAHWPPGTSGGESG